MNQRRLLFFDPQEFQKRVTDGWREIDEIEFISDFLAFLCTLNKQERKVMNFLCRCRGASCVEISREMQLTIYQANKMKKILKRKYMRFMDIKRK